MVYEDIEAYPSNMVEAVLKVELVAFSLFLFINSAEGSMTCSPKLNKHFNF